MNKVKKDVKLSGFIQRDMEGEVLFHDSVPCPKCDGWVGGEDAGAFCCSFCGYSEVPKFSLSHGNSLLLEGTWKVLKSLLVFKHLRWYVSRFLYEEVYEELMQRWFQFRKMITYSSDDCIWDYKTKTWKKMYHD